MIGLLRYGRIHRLWEFLAFVPLAGFATWRFRDVNRVGFESWMRGPPYPVLVLVPLLLACMIVATLYEPFGDLERSLTRRIWAYRAAHVGFIGVVSALAISFGLWPYLEEVAVSLRNLAAMTGTAGLLARLFGAQLAWMPTVLLYVAMYTASSSGTLDRARFPDVLWQWPLLPFGDSLSFLIAAVLATGILLACRLGPREPSIV